MNQMPSISLRRGGAAAREEEPDATALARWVRAFRRRQVEGMEHAREEGDGAGGRKGAAPAGGDAVGQHHDPRRRQLIGQCRNTQRL
ncbi:hypothetical protein E2562_033535 [Oryza meyeriana var. granulata]|uniref:Uncharacterized protein n=1 Tax=Oryza meyeriana var. granulata TaxID=110450 RepID=A0A6G1ES40_9ORYZ|nr:hypothetical protein E2562_033535 [Oryza meyeriana var. granulata]